MTAAKPHSAECRKGVEESTNGYEGEARVFEQRNMRIVMEVKERIEGNGAE